VATHKWLGLEVSNSGRDWINEIWGVSSSRCRTCTCTRSDSNSVLCMLSVFYIPCGTIYRTRAPRRIAATGASCTNRYGTAPQPEDTSHWHAQKKSTQSDSSAAAHVLPSPQVWSPNLRKKEKNRRGGSCSWLSADEETCHQSSKRAPGILYPPPFHAAILQLGYCAFFILPLQDCQFGARKSVLFARCDFLLPCGCQPGAELNRMIESGRR
jgi:hypothetical protein